MLSRSTTFRKIISLIYFVKLEFHYADFHQNFPAGTVAKVVDTNHLDMFATKSVTSL